MMISQTKPKNHNLKQSTGLQSLTPNTSDIYNTFSSALTNISDTLQHTY